MHESYFISWEIDTYICKVKRIMLSVNWHNSWSQDCLLGLPFPLQTRHIYKPAKEKTYLILQTDF